VKKVKKNKDGSPMINPSSLQSRKSSSFTRNEKGLLKGTGIKPADNPLTNNQKKITPTPRKMKRRKRVGVIS